MARSDSYNHTIGVDIRDKGRKIVEIGPLVNGALG